MPFPAPRAPEFPTDQAATTESYLRYEDVTQDGRLISIAIPPALGGMWRGVLVRHPGARTAQAAGIIPILTRLVIAAHEQPIRVTRPIESHAGFELACDADDTGAVSRIFMNVWAEVRGSAPRSTETGLVLAGQLFAEHTFTRPFAPVDKRRVIRLEGGGYPEIPEARYSAPASTTAGDAPDGARWIDELAPDAADVVFTLDQTDSNKHVNSLVYVRLFLEATQRRLAGAGKPLAIRSTAVDIAYRKPCFAGDRVRAHVRLFDYYGTLGAAGFVAMPGEEAKPRCYVRVLFAP